MSVSHDDANELFLSLVRVQKLLLAAKHQAPRAHPGVDTTAYPVLFTLSRAEARPSDLADAIHSDLSTVSRQISALARHGLVEKRPDPEDGRAQVAALTLEGREVVETITRHRSAWFQELLGGWDPDDATTLTRHLEALGDALDRSLRRPAPTASTVPSQEN